MHYSDDDIHSQGSLSKRYVWGRIRQVQSDSDQGSNIFYLVIYLDISYRISYGQFY